MNQLIKLLKSMLSSSGRIVISKSGKGYNLFGLNPDTLDIRAINALLTEQGIAMEAVHFPEEDVPPAKPGDSWTTKDASVYVGPPSELASSSDEELTSLMSSYQE
tara:strand:- start:40 stop:354 length:315 start_codon:yes stop_codon:yes gene_type:complete